MLTTISTFVLIAVTAVIGQVPNPPNPMQFTITAGKSDHSVQYMITTNYVDRLADLFRIDVNNEGDLYEQAFYYGANKTGYIIYYDKSPPECMKIKYNYADMLAEWQTLSFAGKTRSVTDPRIECNMWNKTTQQWTWSYLASIDDNRPIEILDNSILVSVYKNYTIGPSVVPKDVFELPVHEASCK
jgi:hypothetical protein